MCAMPGSTQQERGEVASAAEEAFLLQEHDQTISKCYQIEENLQSI